MSAKSLIIAAIAAASLCCVARAEVPVLTVYTYSSFAEEWGPGPAIKKAFEKDCGCQLHYVALEDGVSLLNRVRLEGKRSKADVVLGLDNNLIDTAKKTGLFAQSSVDLSQLHLPVSWTNQTFIPYDYSYFAFIYDKNRLKNPPQSLHQLVEGPEKWRVIYQDPRTSTPGLGLLLWMQQVFGDQSDQAWRNLAAKTVTVTRGWSEAYGLFLKGEADLVLSYSTSPAFHIIDEHKDNYRAANFSEGHYLQVEVAAQLANSPQPALAKKFLQFLLSPEAQQALPQGNWMYPSTAIPLPEGFKQLTVPSKTLQYSPQQVNYSRSLWVERWQNAVSQK